MLVRWGSAAALLGGVSVIALMAAGIDSAQAQSATALPEVTVTSDKVEGTTYDSPSTVSVHTDKDIDRQNIHTMNDLVRDEPGVSVGNQPTRGGATNYVIRGIGDNRVRVEIDGTKIPDFPGTNLGASTYTRDYIDFDALKRIEIVRGPASALYGSDAIGGVVAYVTKDPGDYLAQVNKSWFFSEKVGFDSTDRTYSSTTTTAWRSGRWEAMVLYTYRYGHEYTPNTSRFANPQDQRTDNILAKSVYNSEHMGQFKLTAELTQKNVFTQLVSEQVGFTSPAPGRYFDSRGYDSMDRPRFSIDWALPVALPIADQIDSKLYWTRVERREISDLWRNNASATATTPNRFRHSDFLFDQSILGTEVRLSAKRNFSGWDHHFTYGFAGDITTSTRPRDRFETNLATLASTNVVAGETFPNKNFPDTTTQNAGLYLQDIMQKGALRVIPAVRFDYYHITPHPDRSFLNSNPGFVINSQTETAISPKLGTTYDLSQNYRVFAQYARGFRAPPYDNANFAFRNTTSFYEIIPNGNLKPETSDGFEGGLRGRFNNGSSFQVSAYYNQYKDFIDTVTLSSPPPPAFTQFQYQNISNVVIFGYEGKGEWRFQPNWSMVGAFAFARGTNEVTGTPLDSVDPFSSLLGLRYINNGWTIEGRARYYGDKDRVSNTTYFHVPAHTVVDTLISYEPSQKYTINFGIYNVFDLAYYDPQAVAGIGAGSANLELYRAAGRTAFINAIVRW
jgi:hemoglobin/transferrin/lactoferrin receptor protein